MTKFEDNLWREVEGKYGPELSKAAGPLHRRSHLRAPVLAGTTLGVLGASAAVIVLTAANSSPAFAVTRHGDGTVSVVIRRIEGITGANRRLMQLGIRARAVRVADGCQLPAARALASVAVMTLARDRHENWVTAAPGAINARIRPAQIPSGRTLVIPAIRTGALVRLVRGRTVRGVVPACLPPAVQILANPGSRGLKIMTCRGGIPPGVRAVPPGQGTNPTSTNAAPPPTTVTQTTATGATTDSGTNTDGTTTTDSVTATNSGSMTGSATTPSSTPAGPAHLQLPPAMLRACRLAAQAATR
jgi:hypothetical protein